MKYKNRKIDYRKPVRVYRNLNKKGIWFSVVQNGLVVAHVNKLHLTECTFKVSEAGRQRVLTNQRKNVHATVTGTIKRFPKRNIFQRDSLISYNPYKAGAFQYKGEPISAAASIIITETGVYNVQKD